MSLTPSRKHSIATLSGLLLLSAAAPAFAQPAPSFSDLPSGHAAFEAVEYLKTQGVISGYADGTFKPNAKVNRAEAVKILIAPLVNAQQLGQLAHTPYEDVAADAWYRPYVEAARQSFGIIDGPPQTTVFHGERPVLKVEFIKMLLLANKADVGAYGEIKLPLSVDVTNTEEWFYPYIRYAVSSSITMISADGTLSPGRELTRSDVALFLHRFLMYREGRRTQALLSEAETEIHNILDSLEKNDITQAEQASARALIAARGAHASKPTEAVTQGAVKTTEAFRALVRAYRAGVSGDLDTVIALASEAWNLAAKAKELDPTLASISDQVQQTAKNMADSARALKAAP
ncbi:S-layer homology domain-containing protein [Candidatus Peregrinibacteria bacterium]|nr:S-layer homology domain-containing protein [Candidatus Peregrinibacteria bacterium]